MKTLTHVSPWNADDVVTLQFDDVAQVIEWAAHAQVNAAAATEDDRSAGVLRLLDALAEDATELADAVHRDTGRLLESCEREVAATLANARGLVASWRARPRPAWRWQAGDVSGLARPLGPALAIVPGNFPFSALIRKVVAALLAGCAVAAKYSERAPRSAQMVNDAVQSARVPVRLVAGAGDETQALLASRVFRSVSFTGSTANGHRVAAAVPPDAAALQVEAGGKNFCIVDDDVELAVVLPEILNDAWADAGQNCVATSRLIVVSTDPAAVTALVREAADRAGAAQGPALFGGLIDPAAAGRAETAIAQAAAGGAAVTRHGSLELPEKAVPEAFMVPAVVAEPPRDGAVWHDDLFAPVLALVVVPNLEEALGAAADSSYALAGAVYSNSPPALERAARRLVVGKLVLNAPPRTGAPEVPLSGFRESGFGPAENGLDGIAFFTRQQVVYVRDGGMP